MNTYRLPPFGMLLVSGLIAGILAYTISSHRAVHERSSREMFFGRAKDLGGTEVARAGREFVSEKVVPEMKPVLLDLLKDAEEYAHRYFQRAEKAIKSM